MKLKVIWGIPVHWLIGPQGGGDSAGFRCGRIFFLSGLGGVLAVVFVVFWWPSDYPAESDLVKVNGEISSVVDRDDIFNTWAGAMMPGGLASAYFTLEGVLGCHYSWRLDTGKVGELVSPIEHPVIRVQDVTQSIIVVRTKHHGTSRLLRQPRGLRRHRRPTTTPPSTTAAVGAENRADR